MVRESSPSSGHITVSERALQNINPASCLNLWPLQRPQCLSEETDMQRTPRPRKMAKGSIEGAKSSVVPGPGKRRGSALGLHYTVWIYWVGEWGGFQMTFVRGPAKAVSGPVPDWWACPLPPRFPFLHFITSNTSISLQIGPCQGIWGPEAKRDLGCLFPPNYWVPIKICFDSSIIALSGHWTWEGFASLKEMSCCHLNTSGYYQWAPFPLGALGIA